MRVGAAREGGLAFLRSPTRHLLFTGKGGVGKTSIASASAIRLADEGRRVLLVSTDPASNLDEVLGVSLSLRPRPVPGVPGLHAMNIDPEAATGAYRARVLDPYRSVLPAPALEAMEEQLSGACTTEIAAFDEFASLLGGQEDPGEWDHILFDTAPTGHTLRLLSLPGAWSQFIDGNRTGTSCLGPVAGLSSQRERYRATVDALADRERTTLVLVARPEPTALREAARTADELRELGFENQQLVVNGILPSVPLHGPDPVSDAVLTSQRRALSALPRMLGTLTRSELPLRGFNFVGLEALRALAYGGEDGPPGGAAPVRAEMDLPGLEELIDSLERDGKGLVMTMGKGGVGKTTVAAAVASALAGRGHRVLLTTTDPAAHVAAAVGSSVPNLEVDRIDPVVESEAYRQKVLAQQGQDLTSEGRELLEEDLRSPCTEEVAVFHAFSRTIARARDRFVVVDTAPTGHTMLLLDTAGSYHREVLRKLKGGRLTTPLMRLQDPDYTKILLVTLAENTPVSEALALQQDLGRAGISPYAWVVNRSLAAGRSQHPILQQRASLESAQIARIGRDLAPRVVAIPYRRGAEVAPGLAHASYDHV